MSSIAELAEDRIVEGVYAVARKRRLRTKSGAAYLALELVDPSGRIAGRARKGVDRLDAGGPLAHTVGAATICRELCQLHPRLRSDLVLAAALLHDVGRTAELAPGPGFRQTSEGHLLGHVHLGVRLIEERADALDTDAR